MVPVLREPATGENIPSRYVPRRDNKAMSLSSTQMIKVDPQHPQEEAITRAAESLREGGLVAFPTETVYGLGADALSSKAIERLFQAKGRPFDNPIIVHVADMSHMHVLTNKISEKARTLIHHFWPGPLTLIFPKLDMVPREVTGGLDTVAVRMPDSNVALALIRAFGGPIAAPSANRSGYPSGTMGKHILQDFDGKIAMILDAGPVEMGVESTVLDISTKTPAILRPGAVTLEQLRSAIGEVVLQSNGKRLERSPGTRYRHYSPKADVVLVSRGDKASIASLVRKYTGSGKRVGLMTRCTELSVADDQSLISFKGLIIKAMPQDLKGYARQMFAALREFDEQGIELIIVEEVEEEGLGVAIMDRLRRATGR